MDIRFKDIKVLIWDIDGTLYKMRPEIKKQYEEAEIKTITEHTGWSKEKANEEFQKLLPRFKSRTKTTAFLSNISTKQAALESEVRINRAQYLDRDENLIHMFVLLSKYKHYLLVNGIQSMTKKTLKTLGIAETIFQEIITSEIVGENKPSSLGFKYILDKTKLAPHHHMMIGDREQVDLEPAKKLGMKTCLVWADKKSEVADVVLPTVYELIQLLT